MDLAYSHLSSATPDQIETFSAATNNPQRWRTELGSGFLERTLRPDWCWQAHTRDGRVAAANCWWGRPGASTPHQLVSVERSHVRSAVDLVEHSRDALGLTEAKAVLSAPVGDPRPIEVVHARYAAILAHTGFRLAVERVRIESYLPVAPAQERLTYRPARSLAGHLLVRLIADVLDDSLDHSMQAGATRHGSTGYAEIVLSDLVGYSGREDWFAVAFTPDDAPVGYVVPATIDGDAVIAELGVARQHRGHGYSADLVDHATRRLADAGFTRVRADTDAANRPMRATFARCGFTEFARRRDYSWSR